MFVPVSSRLRMKGDFATTLWAIWLNYVSLRLLEISVDEQTRRGCTIQLVLNWSRNRHELHLCACKVKKDKWTEGKWKKRISSVTRLTGSNAYISTHSTNFYCIRLRTCIYFVRPFSLFSVLLALHSLRTGIITGVGTGRTLLTVTCVNANEVDGLNAR